MSDQQLHAEVKLGREAKELLENPLLTRAVQDIKNEIFILWQSTQSDQREAREDVWLTHRGMDLFLLKLRAILDNGQIAQDTIEKKKRGKKSLLSPTE